MATTYTLIASNVLSASATSVTFSSIASTYTDLVLRISGRSDNAGLVQENIWLTFNSTSSGYSTTQLTGDGTTGASGTTSSATILRGFYAANSGAATANSFGSAEIYIPSYTGTQKKPVNVFGVGETNATTAYMATTAGLSSITTAITTINIAKGNGTNWVSGSSFYLYGIKNS